MRTTVLKTIAAISISAAFGAASISDHFFPQRPAGATLTTITGVLENWTHGEGVGTIAVKDSSGNTHKFYMGYPARINGKTVLCFSAPGADGDAPSPDPYCTDWPSKVVIGTTKVKAVTWGATLNGSAVQACDEIDMI